MPDATFSAQEIVKSFANKGISLWTESGKLKFRATRGTLSDDDKNLLKSCKEKLIAFLSGETDLAGSFPLTPIQKSYLVGRNPAYDLGGINTHYYLELEIGFDVDVQKLQHAWNKVIQKNDALRLVILETGKQKILKDVPLYIIEEVSFSSQAERLAVREKWNHHFYALNKWPFFTLRISHVSKEKDVLHFDFDCMIMDAWSAKIAIVQMFRIYRGDPVQFPSYTFEKYVKSLKDFEASQDFSEAETFWKFKATELVCEPKLPYSKPLSEIRNHRFSRISSELDVNEYKVLLQKCREYRTTPAAVISTAYLKTLLRYSQDNSLTINSTLFNRHPLSKEIHSVIGDFTNIAYLSLSKNSPTFLHSLQCVQKDMWQLVRFHAYNGTEILKFKSGLRPMRAQMPIVITCVLDGGKSLADIPGLKQIYALSKTPQVVLDYQVTDFDGSLSVNWDYAVPAFDHDVLQEMFHDNLQLLKTLVTNDWEEIF